MPRLHKISLEVEEVAVGTVMRALHNMAGVVAVNYHMDEIGYKQRKSKRSNGAQPPHAGKPRKSFAVTGSDYLLRLIGKAKAPLTNAAARKAFLADGRSENSINSVVHLLRTEGLIGYAPDGGYILTKKQKDRLRHRVSKEA